ncbi:hypothetical protein [Nitratiruptor tergarcus]|uniref:Uncharacterized protein n=1 Tax=Nitratiruptor tergarcus DSM 16512 TaxID=1069081 RepID=A0A1W1WV34_9BACT|nr:hypothetical protein [Nitratiruptor tergarcus]SMC10184.1 hypothetical protein SAMN05660197_2026 [Nitratiruptor tergarcus DSM 16512]
MSKNIVILGIGAAVLILGLGIFLYSPKNDTSPLTSMKQTSTNSVEEDITIKKQTKSSSSIKKEKKKAKPQRKIDPSIKAATIDHYHTYLIQVVDENPEDRNIKLEKDPSSYTYIEGKVSGKEFVMRVPKVVLDKPDVKLRITHLETKESKTLDASFLSEAASLEQGSQFRVDIDFDHPDNIQTQTKMPEERSPFPGIR